MFAPGPPKITIIGVKGGKERHAFEILYPAPFRWQRARETIFEKIEILAEGRRTQETRENIAMFEQRLKNACDV